MARRVLIVSPHFPPVNAPDHQRVRMSLPYLAENGWQAHVLAVEPAFVEGVRDPDLLQTIPKEVPVTRVGALSPRLTRWFGLGNLGIRALRPLDRAGQRLLVGGGFDVVYFSTTVFPAMSLGPRWKGRFAVPYVLDLQDPWVSDYYQRTGVRPPGGWGKFRFSQWLARRAEPVAVRGAGHTISVSPSYPADLLARYPDLDADRFSVLPFGASEADAALVRGRAAPAHVFNPGDGMKHWVYLGRGGADMAPALRGLFLALSQLRQTRAEVQRLRLHFVGTSYAPANRAERTIDPVAQEFGVGDLVKEHTERIPYLDGLALLQASDAILVIGSDDPAYSASKVYPCIMARRPLLALLHEASLAGKVVRDCQAGAVFSFRSHQSTAEMAAAIKPLLETLLDQAHAPCVATDWNAFQAYTARAMTQRQCAIFNDVAGVKRP